ncbi:MAG: pyrroloquinoline quinone-dependent dehydrogenase, partial [Candidatus Hydrogenedentota bacterium]
RFVGEQQYEVHPEGVTGYLYAYEKNKGDFVGRFPLENAPHAVPMTYVHNGRQYIVLGCGGGGQPSEFVALALPKKS